MGEYVLIATGTKVVSPVELGAPLWRPAEDTPKKPRRKAAPKKKAEPEPEEDGCGTPT